VPLSICPGRSDFHVIVRLGSQRVLLDWLLTRSFRRLFFRPGVFFCFIFFPSSPAFFFTASRYTFLSRLRSCPLPTSYASAGILAHLVASPPRVSVSPHPSRRLRGFAARACCTPLCPRLRGSHVVSPLPSGFPSLPALVLVASTGSRRSSLLSSSNSGLSTTSPLTGGSPFFLLLRHRLFRAPLLVRLSSRAFWSFRLSRARCFPRLFAVGARRRWPGSMLLPPFRLRPLLPPHLARTPYAFWRVFTGMLAVRPFFCACPPTLLILCFCSRVVHCFSDARLRPFAAPCSSFPLPQDGASDLRVRGLFCALPFCSALHSACHGLSFWLPRGFHFDGFPLCPPVLSIFLLSLYCCGFLLGRYPAPPCPRLACGLVAVRLLA